MEILLYAMCFASFNATTHTLVREVGILGSWCVLGGVGWGGVIFLLDCGVLTDCFIS